MLTVLPFVTLYATTDMNINSADFCDVGRNYKSDRWRCCPLWYWTKLQKWPLAVLPFVTLYSTTNVNLLYFITLDEFTKVTADGSACLLWYWTQLKKKSVNGAVFLVILHAATTLNADGSASNHSGCNYQSDRWRFWLLWHCTQLLKKIL